MEDQISIKTLNFYIYFQIITFFLIHVITINKNKYAISYSKLTQEFSFLF